MKINVTLPFDYSPETADEFVTMDAVLEISKLADKLGFNAGNVTDHPCPTARWRDSGGHDPMDPFALLGFIAAATTNLRLQTGILVLPYRNPLLTARQAASVDVLSNGRLTLGLGAGYLKGEFFALGANFDERNNLMDEYINAMKAAWTGEAFDFEGTGYSARGSRIRPKPVQQNGIPLFIGGNSKRAIRRAVELGDAWNPFFTGNLSTETTRTGSMGSDSDLDAGIAYLKEQSEKIGREVPPDVFLASVVQPGERPTAEEMIDRIGQYQDKGVVGAAVGFDAKTRAEWCDKAEAFATDVLAKIN